MLGVTIVQTVVKFIFLAAVAFGGIMLGKSLRIKKNRKDGIAE